MSSTSQTAWDKIITGEELRKVKTNRARPYIVSKERRSALSELQEEGWSLVKEYKDEKWIGVQKDKPFDEVFEDKVWCLFSNMGFDYLNSDRHFKMIYDFQGLSTTQQIDVFAADQETVIIVECKAADSPKDGVFKKEIEAFGGKKAGLIREAQQKFPGAKVKLVWAVKNYIMSSEDMDRLKNYDIAFFGDSAIEYYTDLVKHLGISAKYQLLGNFFPNSEIRNLEDKIPAIEGKMGGHTYYSFSIEPDRLLKIGYVLHRKEAHKDLMPTYQRIIKKKRLIEVRNFINEGGYFPNSIVISIDTRGKKLNFDEKGRLDGSLSRIGILHLPKYYRSAYIIDGQHRLYGYSESLYAKSNSIPVVAFVNLDRQEQIQLFMDINENQKAVPKTLRVTLNADMLWESDDYNERRQALGSKIAQMLGEEPTSPLLGRVIMGEEESNKERTVTVAAIQQALKKCNFFSVFGKKNSIVKNGTFDVGENQDICDLFYPFLESCLLFIKANSPDEWVKNDNDGLIVINRGIQAIIRVIDDLITHLIETDDLNPRTTAPKVTAKKLEFYLSPLCDYFNTISDADRKDLRSYFGGGGDKRFWMAFRKAISDVRTEFKPEGLDEYWLNEAKQFNEDSSVYLRDIEVAVKELIQDRLQTLYGDQWLIKGLPKDIYRKSKDEADTKNYENINSGNDTELIDQWDCVSLSDCKSIITYGTQWKDCFQSEFVRPEDQNSQGTKEVKTEWLSKLNVIQNRLTRPNYSVSAEDFELIRSIHNWMCKDL